MNTAPRRSARIAAKMVHVAPPVAAPAPMTPRRSARIATKVAANNSMADTGMAVVAAAPAIITPRRSARLAAKSKVVYCADGSTYKRNPSHWTTNPAYIGLIPYTCAKLDNDIMAMREYLEKVDVAKGAVNKAERVIEIFEYLYTNQLLILRVPRFRTVAMEKLAEIHNDSWVMANITPTQRRMIKAQYKLFTERYNTMVSHPLYRV